MYSRVVPEVDFCLLLIHIMDAISNQGVDLGCIELLTNIYNRATSKIILDRDSREFQIQGELDKVMQYLQSFSTQDWKRCSENWNGITKA